MNLRGVDLNLLVVLSAVLEEAHVSRAADRLGLSQPATSSALDRCRHLFADPLLERRGARMQRTPKGERLRAPLRRLLADVGALVDAPEVPLVDLRQTVRVVMADHPAMVVAGALHHALAATAPGLDLVVLPWRGAPEAMEQLARGSADLALSVFAATDADIRREELLEETYRVVMRRGHPTATRFDLDAWLAFPHILVSGRGEAHGAVDEALLRLGRRRRVGMVVPSFLLVPSLLGGSDLVAMMPSRCVPVEPAGAFAVFAPPIAVPGFPLHLAWHARADADRAVQHVAGLIRDCLSGLPVPPLAAP
ncbi:LysR family transcriptional regulator [Methylobrevis albus]|uniref:LysR family transcriptional regulator n=1 Tax=Methylobrevis albus TaxID=2793297 RepID=A0A931HYZ9_9HYPH|nr:LysR substrate-binding domain-containing protein [Methylobrevis albus]MBH0236264.1 LysR family transcriptional regulator [Methylobrevis albus]